MAANDHKNAPFVLGITGPIACGKTTAGTILLELGALARIDADEVVHSLMRPHSPVTVQVASVFGPSVITADGAVDRARLASTVFGDPEALARLESIVHPAVRAAIRARIESFSGCAGVIVVDAVKLLQSDLLPLCDAVWVIRCAPTEQLRRLRDERHMHPEAIDGRLAAQPAFEHPRVTRVIENSGDLTALRARIAAEWATIQVTVQSV
jgi:dephospho-CoA kinase